MVSGIVGVGFGGNGGNDQDPKFNMIALVIAAILIILIFG